MAVTYKKLFHLLIDRGVGKSQRVTIIFPFQPMWKQRTPERALTL